MRPKSLSQVKPEKVDAIRNIFNISVEETDAAGRFTGVLKVLDSCGAVSYYRGKQQGELGTGLSTVDMRNPG